MSEAGPPPQSPLPVGSICPVDPQYLPGAVTKRARHYLHTGIQDVYSCTSYKPAVHQSIWPFSADSLCKIGTFAAPFGYQSVELPNVRSQNIPAEVFRSWRSLLVARHILPEETNKKSAIST